ncbi:Dicarboxylate/amino acid:cation symporter [Globisporangium polare]
MATPIVLLDEEQQRSLQQQQQSSGRTQFGAPSTNNSQRQNSFGANSYPMTPASESSSEARPNYAVPKTNFTSAEPRTNFTSAAMSARTNERRLHDHVVATGGRATDMQSIGTLNSSPKTNFTSRKFAADFDLNYGDSTPPLLSDRLSDTLGPDEKEAVAGYVGSSSGLKLKVSYILFGVMLGVGLGVLLSSLKVSTLAARWISLPGDLFLRAMKALVVPYVFCSVAVAIGDIVFVGKVSVVGLQTFKVFVIMWIAASVLGMGMALLFRPLFRFDRVYISSPTNAIGFTCANGKLLETLANSSLACAGNSTTLGGITGTAAFEVKDINKVFSTNTKTALALMSLSDQILAILNLIVPKNIFTSLSNGDLLSTITFAMVFGAIAGRNYFTKTRRVNYLYLVLLQLRNAFFLAMEWVIWLTPVAVVSIIAGSFASNEDSVKQLKDVYLYVLASICTAAIQVLLVQPAIIFVLTRCNPYKHMAHMVESYVFAFAVSSSVATAPITLTCVKKARVCSQSLANFVISIGVCSNMSGAGFYYPLGIMFLAESSGNGAELTPLRLLAVFLLSILACAGTPPIPSAGVVLMATVYKTVFGVSDLPSTFPLYLAVDFLVDRISTVCNVNDDIMALKVIAENTDETIVGDHLGERE